MRATAIFRPKKGKKELVREILRDLDPSLREHAEEILLSMSEEELMDKERVLRKLREKTGKA